MFQIHVYIFSINHLISLICCYSHRVWIRIVIREKQFNGETNIDLINNVFSRIEYYKGKAARAIGIAPVTRTATISINDIFHNLSNRRLR